MKKVSTYLAASLAVLSTGGAWALYSNADEHIDHGSGSDHGSHDQGSNSPIYYYPPTTGGGYTTDGGYTSPSTGTEIPQQTTPSLPLPVVSPTESITPIPTVTETPIVTPTLSPTTSPTASASPVVFGVLGPCPSTSVTTGATPEPSVTPTSTASPAAIPQCINVEIPANASTLGSAAYGTNPLVVPIDTTVTWYNDDSVAHSVTADDGSFDSGLIPPGGNFSLTFSNNGTYPFHDSANPSLTGTVQVGPAPSVTPTASPTSSPAGTPTVTPTVAPTASPGVSPTSTASPGEMEM